MINEMTGSFATRRDSEMAIEPLVQEHGIARDAIEIEPADEENTVGSTPGGFYRQETIGYDRSPVLHGRINVISRLKNPDSANAVQKSFAEFSAKAPPT